MYLVTFHHWSRMANMYSCVTSTHTYMQKHSLHMLAHTHQLWSSKTHPHTHMGSLNVDKCTVTRELLRITNMDLVSHF